MSEDKKEMSFIEGTRLLFKFMTKPKSEEVIELTKDSTVAITVFGTLGLILVIIKYLI